MKYRICNGNGQAFYEIGVADNGDPLGISKDVFEKVSVIVSTFRMFSNLLYSLFKLYIICQISLVHHYKFLKLEMEH